MKNKQAPQAFVNYLNKIGKECPVQGWQDLKEWQSFKAGYNAAVERVNAKIMASYDMETTIKKVIR